MFRFGGFLFPFPNCFVRILVPLIKKVSAKKNSNCLNILNTRHIIYSISEKVCLEKLLKYSKRPKSFSICRTVKGLKTEVECFTTAGLFQISVIFIAIFWLIFYSTSQQDSSRNKQTMIPLVQLHGAEVGHC